LNPTTGTSKETPAPAPPSPSSRLEKPEQHVLTYKEVYSSSSSLYSPPLSPNFDIFETVRSGVISNPTFSFGPNTTCGDSVRSSICEEDESHLSVPAGSSALSGISEEIVPEDVWEDLPPENPYQLDINSVIKGTYLFLAHCSSTHKIHFSLEKSFVG